MAGNPQHILWLCSIFIIASYGQISKPNILFFLVDDLGYNDIGYHDCSFATPVIDTLAAEGIILESNYWDMNCVPSRSALLTGRYSFNTGFQTWFHPSKPICLPNTHPLLPEALKSLGYNTYMLGKWSLGFCNVNCTPTYHGFDKFYGFYNTHINHFDHELDGLYDLQDGLIPDTCVYGQYASNLFAARAHEYLRSHVQSNTTKDKPFFMQLALPTVHIPMEAPIEYIERQTQEPDPNRKVIKAMMNVVDDILGDLVQQLKNLDLYENTIIIFSSDNGGQAGISLNSPLRGAKATAFEGGLRVPGFVHSALFQDSAGTVSEQLIHVTDWYPTLVSMAGGDVSDFLDGFDQTGMIVNGETSPRLVIPLHIELNDVTTPDTTTYRKTAIRSGKWKLIMGQPGGHDGYDSVLTGPDALHVTNSEDYLAPNDVMLFDLEADPTERVNLADVHPGVVQELIAQLDSYRDGVMKVDAEVSQRSPEYNLEQYGYTWNTGWC